MPNEGTIGALFEECYSIVELHATFTQGLQKAHANYIQEVKKRIKGPRFVEPPIALPNPPNIDNPPHLRTNSSVVVGSSEPHVHTPPGAKPRGRPARGAALRARQGVTDSYKYMSTTKLRRPSNFDSTKCFQPMPTIPGTPANLNIGFGAASSSTYSVPPTEPNRVAPGPSSSKDVFKIPPLPAAPAPSRSSKRPTRSKAKENSSPVVATGDISSSEDSGSEEKGVRRSNRGRASKRKNTYQIPEVDRRSRSRVSKVTVNSVTHVAESEDSSDSPNELKQTFKKSRLGTGSSTMVNGADIEFIEPNVPLEPADPHKTRTKTIRKNKMETGSSTMVNGADIEFIEPADANSHKTRTKTIRKNKEDTTTTLNVDNTVSLVAEPMDVTRTRTKTLTKNKSDTTTTLNVDNTVSLVAEPMDVTRTRTKTLTKNKSDTTTTLNVDNTVPLVAEPMDVTRTRTKTLTKNKSAEESSKLGSTYCAASTADLGPAASDSKVAAATDDPVKAVEMSKTFRRSRSCPKNNTITRASNGETFKVPDPMDTLELPGGSQYFTSEQDSKKRLNACDIPDVKRRKSGDDPVEQLVGVVLQNAPRTRSKMKAIAESRARSAESRTPGQGKENSGILPINFIIGSVTEGVKPTTPLATLNMISPKAKTTGSAARNKPARFLKEPIKEIEKAKLAEVRRKEAEALKKKQELMQLKKQEIRNQRETKIKKVAESRKAVEKEKMLQLEKEKKEREEKEKQAKAEMIRQKEEALLKKKLLNQQKAQEAEERRQKEEQLRLAKLREQEEEQRKAAEARHRQLEEAERLAVLRKQQQKEEEVAKLLEKEKAKEKAKHAKAAKDVSDPDDYGIDDDDGDEQETKPRRPIPKWAEKEERTKQLKVQTSLPLPIVRSFFNVEPRTPNLREIFGREAFIRPRTSSAVWATPPPPPPGLDP